MWRGLYRNKMRKGDKEMSPLAMLYFTPPCQSQFSDPAKIKTHRRHSERFWREGPGVGGERGSWGRKPNCRPGPGRCIPPLRPPGFALGLRLGRRGTGWPGCTPAPGCSQAAGRAQCAAARKERAVQAPPVFPPSLPPPTSALLWSPW